jgi:hypothetical protein
MRTRKKRNKYMYVRIEEKEKTLTADQLTWHNQTIKNGYSTLFRNAPPRRQGSRQQQNLFRNYSCTVPRLFLLTKSHAALSMAARHALSVKTEHMYGKRDVSAANPLYSPTLHSSTCGHAQQPHSVFDKTFPCTSTTWR